MHTNGSDTSQTFGFSVNVFCVSYLLFLLFFPALYSNVLTGHAYNSTIGNEFKIIFEYNFFNTLMVLGWNDHTSHTSSCFNVKYIYNNKMQGCLLA